MASPEDVLPLSFVSGRLTRSSPACPGARFSFSDNPDVRQLQELLQGIDRANRRQREILAAESLARNGGSVRHAEQQAGERGPENPLMALLREQRHEMVGEERLRRNGRSSDDATPVATPPSSTGPSFPANRTGHGTPLMTIGPFPCYDHWWNLVNRRETPEERAERETRDRATGGQKKPNCKISEHLGCLLKPYTAAKIRHTTL
ncbi:hypothetical protein QBC46DRAFT_126322 [Diplogelasinospora grovesii]|uniref:Uncharacterized protein n=1 Tax=Diplogelasinospora grovesii TaxID=303347 RepID=A0AAN6N7M8_9PEZI|nr:hypothetical protein QBC46DRAFT_126322 [Diplogelasinospora grovesii]